MKKKYLIITFFGIASSFFLFLFSTKAYSNLFQNSDQSCEVKPILCSSSTCDGFGDHDADTIACKNFNASSLDFNQDGARDCVIGRGSGIDTKSFSYLLGNTGSSCGNQFSSVEDHSLNILGPGFHLGSIVAGSLGGSDAVFIPSLDSPAKFVAVVKGGVGTDESSLVIDSSDSPSWDAGLFGTNQNGFAPYQGEKNTAIFDCNQDGASDFAMVIQNDIDHGMITTSNIQLNILTSDGTVLNPINSATQSFVVSSNSASSKTASLTVGDFNNDQTQDVAVSVNDATESSIVICTNDGVCGFSCNQSITLDQDVGQNPAPFSIAAGDFDGDEMVDIVITEPGLTLPGVRYFFNDGSGIFSGNNTNFVQYTNAANHTAQTLAVGCFNNDNSEDIAVSYSTASDAGLEAITLTPGSTTAHKSPLIYSTSGSHTQPLGIDSADFDGQGGDDFIVLATFEGTTRNAYVFMNTVETMSVSAGSDQTVNTGDVVSLTANCTYSPSDPSDEFEYTWSLTRPSGSVATLTSTNIANPQFTADVDGTYTLQLQCRSRCTDIHTATMTVTSDTTTVPGTTGLPPGLTTQGGCVSSLTPFNGPGGFSYTFVMLAPAFLFGLRKTFRRKG